MAYPMAPATTFREFRDRLATDFNCAYKHMANPIVTTKGAQHTVSYFERDIPGKSMVQCVVTIDDDNERMLPSQIRSICTRLEVDPAVFGLTLG